MPKGKGSQERRAEKRANPPKCVKCGRKTRINEAGLCPGCDEKKR